MKLLFDITLFLSLLATCLSLNASMHGNGSPNSLRTVARRTEESCDSVKKIICQLKNTRTFCELVTKAVDTFADFGIGLEGGTPYTVFAPTDDAFDEIADRFADLSPEESYRTLLFHFYKDVVMTYETLDCSSKLTSLTGDTSRTKCRRQSAGVYEKNQRGKGNTEIGDWPRIEDQSKEACAGIVHRIDHVMLPALFEPFKDLAITDPSEDVPDPAPEPSASADEASKPIEEEDNNALIIPEKNSGNAENPEEPSNTLDLDRSETPTTGDNIPGTNIPQTDPSSEITKTTENEVSEEPETKGPKIGALGINLIIFSTLLLCFVFVCMRR